MSDPVILSYFDSLLRQSDIALLEKPNWLNDKIIGFAFQYYEEVNKIAIFLATNVFV